ncbi:UNVERIFIED_CONTAM: hypothetical protein Sindi_0673800 [Sesamum indicum]
MVAAGNNKGWGTCAERTNDRATDLETSISLKISKSLGDIIHRLAPNQPRTMTGRFAERLVWSGQNHWSHLHCPAEASRRLLCEYTLHHKLRRSWKQPKGTIYKQQ